ncbi:hypothetical protein ACS0TY_000779 [Phlomoides rotata]
MAAMMRCVKCEKNISPYEAKILCPHCGTQDFLPRQQATNETHQFDARLKKPDDEQTIKNMQELTLHNETIDDQDSDLDYDDEDLQEKLQPPLSEIVDLLSSRNKLRSRISYDILEKLFDKSENLDSNK